MQHPDWNHTTVVVPDHAALNLWCWVALRAGPWHYHVARFKVLMKCQSGRGNNSPKTSNLSAAEPPPSDGLGTERKSDAFFLTFTEKDQVGLLLLPSHVREHVPGFLMSSLFWPQYDCVSGRMASWKRLLEVLLLLTYFFPGKKPVLLRIYLIFAQSG